MTILEPKKEKNIFENLFGAILVQTTSRFEGRGVRSKERGVRT